MPCLGVNWKKNRRNGSINVPILLALSFFFLAALPVEAQLSRVSTVFVIALENHDWSQIKGAPNAPYINNTLMPQASYAEQYYNPPGIHPSLPNYLWREAGTNFGITNDDDPSSNHQSTTAHLVTQLKNAGISWKTYQEDVSGSNCPLTAVSLYTPKHDPFVYFDDVTDANDVNSTYCIAHVRPFTEMSADLKTNTVARYVFITPNLCHDGHDSCTPENDPIRQTDNWLAANVPDILKSAAYKNGGAVFLTWDEGESGDGPIGLIALSPYAKGGGYSNRIYYTHGSLLRTMEEIFGVSLLADGALQTDLSDLFSATPAVGPVINEIVNAASFRSPGVAAAGSIVTIFGDRFGVQDNLVAFPATSVNGVSTLFGATAAPIFALAAMGGQINVLVPTELPVSGTVNVMVQTTSGISNALPLKLAPAVPGIFFYSDPLVPTRRNAAAVRANTLWIAMPPSMAANIGLPTNCSALGAQAWCAEPAHPGDYLEIYVTGLGTATPGGDPSGAILPSAGVAPISGDPLYRTISTPTVTIGGQEATVLFSGVAPGFNGLYQVNVKIPANVALGDDVPIEISLGEASDAATVAIR
jgi:uncharacterized protein (TIGR03437 family)